MRLRHRRDAVGLRRPAEARSRVLAAIALLAIGGCASPGSAGCPTCLIQTKPVVHKPPIAWHVFDVTILSQLEDTLNPLRIVRALVGRPELSEDLHSGHLAQTSFFTDRDIEGLSPEAVRLGPTNPEKGIAPPFLVTRLKSEGKTAGFKVVDARGTTYLLKLDVLGYPELVTGAEVVTSKLLYALGYFVPSYEIVDVAVSDLRLDPVRSHVSQEELDEILEGRIRDGRVRASASRFLDGEILGPIPFKRYRRCAELRALKLAYAWVHDTDSKDHNSLFVWTGNRAIGYLIDFGTSLGGRADRGPKTPCQGWVNDVDLKDWTLTLLTLSFHRNGCDPKERPFSPAIGLFSPRVDPRRWEPYIPNLAFEDMTQADAEWMARRMARLSHAQIEAAVSAGRYSNPSDAAYLIDTLEARRRMIVRTYLGGEPS